VTQALSNKNLFKHSFSLNRSKERNGSGEEDNENKIESNKGDYRCLLTAS
jgi:hypothetical protein